jgi:hypothetical protein
MATVMSKSAVPPPNKIKRPPPPIQMPSNGTASQSSPLLSSKRPPNANAQPLLSDGSNGMASPAPGMASRNSVRRRESQKPGDLIRSKGLRVGSDALQLSSKGAKKTPDPYGKPVVLEIRLIHTDAKG